MFKGLRFKLCQISNKVINPPSTPLSKADQYYKTLWAEKEKDGYYKSGHYWEIPLWMAELSRTIPVDNDIKKMIIDNHWGIGYYIFDPSWIHCFSVLDCNLHIIQEIIRENPDVLFYLGGYVDPSIFDQYDNVEWFESVEAFAHGCGFDYVPGVSYKLFEGEYTIPRLTMSYGCNHQCKFCTVEYGVTAVDNHVIQQQIEAMCKDLNFKLVYLNDKTFGQCANSTHLRYIGREIKKQNEEFEGFIVQTSCAQVVRTHWTFDDPWIKVVELGVESYNDDTLHKINKPQNTAMIDHAVRALYAKNKKIIANIMLGLPGETGVHYGNTIQWLYENRKRLYALNIYTLAIYEDAALALEINADGCEDRDENVGRKSFWTDAEKRAYKAHAPMFYDLGITIVADQHGEENEC